MTEREQQETADKLEEIVKETEMKNIIVGTAGHVDHGKTCLIKALTGTDTDRLKRKKKRGITIENGFADMQCGDYNISVIDVPGHEKFIKNMLAGIGRHRPRAAGGRTGRRRDAADSRAPSDFGYAEHSQRNYRLYQEGPGG